MKTMRHDQTLCPRGLDRAQRLQAGLLALALVFIASPARAALRDPTTPPPAAQASAASGTVSAAGAPDALPHHIVVANGRSYVVERGQRFGVGDTLASGARVARIDTDAVWLRDAAGLRRVPLYAGVVKRAVPAADASPSSPAVSAPPDRVVKRSTDRTGPLPKDAP